MIITRTPLRISFFGGGTDYPVWYREHGGAVLATAIDKYCYINCRYLPPFFQHHSRIIYSRIENVNSNDEIEHPAVRACLQMLDIREGIEIHHDADLPARTGLGTSSAFVVGLLHALFALREQLQSKCELARLATEIEQVRLQENVGVQDQITVAHGGFNFVRFCPDGEIAVEPLVVPRSRLDELSRHLHLYFTGFSRTASEIARHQIANTPSRMAELSAMQAMAEQGRNLLVSSQASIETFGALLHEAWRLKKRLSDRISSAGIDNIYERARAAGALGGKLLGAGGGGFMLFFVPPERQPAFLESMRPLLRVPFSFAPSGSEITVYEPGESYSTDLSRDRRDAYRQHA